MVQLNNNNNLVYLSEALNLAINSLKNGGKVHLHIISESMQPCLLPEDIIQVSSVDPINLHLGDIIVYQKGNELITHRLLKWDLSGYYLKGDSRMELDDQVLKESIIGIVEEINRDGHIIVLKNGYFQFINRLLGWLELHKSLSFYRYKKANEYILARNGAPNLFWQSKLLFYRLVIGIFRLLIILFHALM